MIAMVRRYELLAPAAKEALHQVSMYPGVASLWVLYELYNKNPSKEGERRKERTLITDR